MAKATAIKKKEFNLNDIKGEFSSNASYKPQEYYDLGPEFLDATGLPGPAKGHINMFLGHSDTGKTTALINTIKNAQACGDLPIIIITEQKWSFDHAKMMGFNCESKVDESTGEIFWDGDFIFNNNFDYIEQITDYINKMLDLQLAGKLPMNLCFVWDSVGSVPCKMTFEGKGGKQHNAGVLSDKIGMGLNQRIAGSRKATSKYTNTMVIVNQPWVALPENPMSQPKIQAKGGNAIWLNSSLVFLFGNQKDAGISKIAAVKDKRKVKYAVRSKISVLKNHINGLGYEDGKIIVTPHGFLRAKDTAEEKASLERYKEEYAEYWKEILHSTDTNFTIVDGIDDRELLNPEDVIDDE